MAGFDPISIVSSSVSAVVESAKDLISEFITDKDEANRLSAKITEVGMEHQTTALKAAQSVIVAEAQGESWLQRSWRPVVMLVFCALIVARWLGFAAPNLTPELELKLFSILELGIGGYIIGRSGEKIVERASAAFRKTLKK